MRILSYFATFLLVLAVAGCASRKEIETMESQLNYLERSSAQTQDHLKQLDSLYQLTIQKNVSYQADLKVALADLIDKSNIIDGRLTDMEKRMATILDRMDSPQARANMNIGTQGGTPADSSNAKQAATVDPKKLFDNAYGDAHAQKYDLAILEFGEYLSQFKDGQQAGDAQFWLGECYYGKKEYAKAIPEFEKVEKNYPNSDMLTTSLFKLARSYEETGNKKKATAIFQRIVKDFPNSLEAKQASSRLKDQ